MNVSDGWTRVTRLDEDKDDYVHAECDEDECDGGLWVKKGEKVCDECYVSENKPIETRGGSSSALEPMGLDADIGPRKDDDRDKYYYSKKIILPGADGASNFWWEVQ